MRRALLLGAVGVALAAGTVLAVAPPTGFSSPTSPRITRLFIPAIKTECLDRTGLPADSDIGYDFTPAGALVTIDQDGGLTGLPAYTLFRLNECLDDYPIEQATDLPRDRYSRNLLYDYFSTSLRPCLTGHVGDLPALPSRADFVVRLYRWDPYRGLAPKLQLPDLLAMESECPALPPYLVED
jgi:hypothetical protein